MAIVTLKPPNAWHMDLFGEESDEIGEYRLRSLGNKKTKLEMLWKVKWKNIIRVPTLKELTEVTGKDWDKRVIAIEKDYGISEL